MKAVNFFSRIFCSGATMKARVKFDELVAKYSKISAKDIEELIKNLSDEEKKRYPSLSNSTFRVESHQFQNNALIIDETVFDTDNHQVAVFGPYSEIKRNKKSSYLSVDWRITGVDGDQQKVKDIVYKIETI
jgi:hypothetical protein